MQMTVLRSAALTISAVLAGSVLTGVSAAAATPSSSCVATELRLPAGTPTAIFAGLSASDSSGRYQVGYTQTIEGDFSPLFWADGEPQRLEPIPGSRTSLIDVNKRGTVLGQTQVAGGQTQAWLYSNGTLRKLKPPAHITGITVSALNNRGDVVGYGADTVNGGVSAVVWPAGGKPQRLRIDGSAYTTDINDAGVVVGNTSDTEREAGVIWKRWDTKGALVTGKDGADVSLTKIRGNWFIGIQTNQDGSLSGGLWNTRSTRVVSFPTNLDAVNSSGDVAYLTDDGTSIVARPDGTQYVIDAEGYNTVRYLFERGQAYDAAGDRDYGFSRAILWSGCSA